MGGRDLLWLFSTTTSTAIAVESYLQEATVLLSGPFFRLMIRCVSTQIMIENSVESIALYRYGDDNEILLRMSRGPTRFPLIRNNS
jgi:hypothetical protein